MQNRKYKRVLSVGDIHGEYDKLCKIIKNIQYNQEEDLLIFHGDYVDRGEQNLACIYKIMELELQGAIALKGNHELFMQSALEEMIFGKRIGHKFDYELWRYNGGTNTYNELQNLNFDELFNIYHWVSSLQIVTTYNDYIFVHAGVDATVPFKQNTTNDFLWARESFINIPVYPGKTVIFGHTPTWLMQTYDFSFQRKNAKIWYDPINNDKIGIDCGAIFGGRLACLEIPSMKEIYVS